MLLRMRSCIFNYFFNSCSLFFAAAACFVGWPTFLPRNWTPRTRCNALMVPSSGVPLPSSYDWIRARGLLHFSASCFCVMIGSNDSRPFFMADPRLLSTVFGLMMSSDRSTLVRNWPEPTPDDLAYDTESAPLPRRQCTPVTYCVACSILLLGIDGAPATFGGIQCGVASDDRLSLRRPATPRLASDFGNGIPVGHGDV
jgi:hypothetical protein